MNTLVPFGELPDGAEFQRVANGAWWRKVPPYLAFSHTQTRQMTINCESVGPRGQISVGTVWDTVLVMPKEREMTEREKWIGDMAANIVYECGPDDDMTSDDLVTMVFRVLTDMDVEATPEWFQDADRAALVALVEKWRQEERQLA